MQDFDTQTTVLVRKILTRRSDRLSSKICKILQIASKPQTSTGKDSASPLFSSGFSTARPKTTPQLDGFIDTAKMPWRQNEAPERRENGFTEAMTHNGGGGNMPMKSQPDLH